MIAWKNKINQKADMFIKYKNYVKGISLKYGHNNSIHNESINSFREYLESLNIPYKVVEYYLSYHYGYEVNEDGTKDYSKILTAEEYKEKHQEEIDILNKYINKTRIIVDMIDRFLVMGTNSKYAIDAFISGSVDDYAWMLKEDLYDLILSKRNTPYTSPHVSCLTIGPKTRNMNRDCNHPKDRYRVCIRWNYIKESIEEFKSNLKK